jgi:hypothetical protein
MATNWTEEEERVLAELGSAEVARRIGELGDWDRYETLVTVAYETNLTAKQIIALGRLAEALQSSCSEELVIRRNNIDRPKPAKRLAAIVAQWEIRNRKERLKKEAEEASAGLTDWNGADRPHP